MLGSGCGNDALVLANPWTFDEEDSAPPPEAIRARYAAKLKDPREWLRLAKGEVSLGKLVKGLARAAGPAAAPTSLAAEIEQGLARFPGPVRILIAERDRTGQAFLAGWNARDSRLNRCAGADHAYSDVASRAWLLQQILSALADE
jgi:hypothetical protein